MKYMLIEVMEREISEPEYFDTHDAAHDEMCRRVAEVYDISPDEVKESYLEGEDLNENAVVLEDIAWAERYLRYQDIQALDEEEFLLRVRELIRVEQDERLPF